MITILKHKQNTIYYKCSCGTQGMCYIKPEPKNTALVVDVVCPVCGEAERMTLLQYNSEEQRDELLGNIESLDLSWVPSFTEELDEEN